MNNATVPNNPQLKMRVSGKENVEIFCLLLVDMPIGGQGKEYGIGFSIYELKG